MFAKARSAKFASPAPMVEERCVLFEDNLNLIPTQQGSFMWLLSGQLSCLISLRECFGKTYPHSPAIHIARVSKAAEILKCSVEWQMKQCLDRELLIAYAAIWCCDTCIYMHQYVIQWEFTFPPNSDPSIYALLLQLRQKHTRNPTCIVLRLRFLPARWTSPPGCSWQKRLAVLLVMSTAMAVPTKLTSKANKAMAVRLRRYRKSGFLLCSRPSLDIFSWKNIISLFLSLSLSAFWWMTLTKS